VAPFISKINFVCGFWETYLPLPLVRPDLVSERLASAGVPLAGGDLLTELNQIRPYGKPLASFTGG